MISLFSSVTIFLCCSLSSAERSGLINTVFSVSFEQFSFEQNLMYSSECCFNPALSEELCPILLAWIFGLVDLVRILQTVITINFGRIKLKSRYSSTSHISVCLPVYMRLCVCEATCYPSKLHFSLNFYVASLFHMIFILVQSNSTVFRSLIKKSFRALVESHWLEFDCHY